MPQNKPITLPEGESLVLGSVLIKLIQQEENSKKKNEVQDKFDDGQKFRKAESIDENALYTIIKKPSHLKHYPERKNNEYFIGEKSESALAMFKYQHSDHGPKATKELDYVLQCRCGIGKQFDAALQQIKQGLKTGTIKIGVDKLDSDMKRNFLSAIGFNTEWEQKNAVLQTNQKKATGPKR